MAEMRVGKGVVEVRGEVQESNTLENVIDLKISTSKSSYHSHFT